MKSIIISSLLALSICSFGQTSNCKPLDFLQLKDSSLQDQLFIKIDSILKVQYPNNDKENIMVDLNKKWLDKFLNSINTDTFKIKNSFTFKVQFGNTIDNSKDTTCLDDISIKYNSNCSFTLTLSNYVLADPTWCSGVSVLYHFRLNNGKITSFGRNAAG